MVGYLVLANGVVFSGEMLNGPVCVDGEAVFNTSMNGYQEIITDPSYAGQILTFTYPSIGNYGCGDYGFESPYPALRGLVLHEMAAQIDHYQARWTLTQFLQRCRIPCLTGIDTRALTRILRSRGTMGAVLTTSLEERDHLVGMAARGESWQGKALVDAVTQAVPSCYGDGELLVVVLDCGVKQHILDALTTRGCRVMVMPAGSSADQIMATVPDGLVLSNGPGDPQVCAGVVAQLRQLLPIVPTLGICLGHQLIALAAGARTYKMKFGHRGGNHTVKDLRSGRCLVSAQNHGYAVDPASLPEGMEVSFINLNDGSVEGLVHRERPIMSVQFHPEAAPGPHDSSYLFDQFLAMVRKQREKKMSTAAGL